MIGNCFLYIVSLCCLTLHFVNCAPNVLKQTLNIDLSNYNKTNQSSHVFLRYINLAQGNAVVKVQNAPNNQGFFVIQAHSLRANISLANSSGFAPRTIVTGTNIGLVEQNLGAGQTYQYYVRYQEQPSLKVLLAVVVYEKTDPVPGGCNMIFNTEIAPYQLVSYNDNIIRVDAQPPYAPGHICESNPSHVDMYHMYLHERSLDDDAYFEGIRLMLTVDSIKANGRRVPEPIGHSIFRRYYSAYPGTGSVYAIVATYKNSISAYVPAVTYACDINNWDESCFGPVTVGWKIICAVILFMGLFTCYFGHRFFKTQMFIFGFVFGGFISYVSASILDTLSVGESLGISLIFGSIYGAMWIVFWWRFGSPILSVFLPVAFIGYITACIVFYTGFGDFQLFQSDVNYWGVFFSIVFPMTVLLLIVTMYANILACSVLGASAVTVAVDHYVGGNLHYTILNNIRRATVTNFNLAVIDPPFQYREPLNQEAIQSNVFGHIGSSKKAGNSNTTARKYIILSVVWLFLVLTGVYAQLRQQRGKPPFPPPQFITRRSPERTPLLSSGQINPGHNA